MNLPTIQPRPSSPVNKKTRVLFVDHTPILGGAQISLLELLETVDRDLFDVAVACSNRCEEFLESAEKTGAKVFVVKFPRLRGNFVSLPLRYIGTTTNLVNVCRKFKPDIIHSNSVRTHIYGATAAKLTRAKAVWTLRDFEFPKRVFARLVRWADAVISISEAIHRNYDGGHNYPHLHIVPNGICAPQFNRSAARSQVREEFRIPDDAPVAGSVGRMLPWKGQLEFVKAAAKVSSKLPEARFILMGNVDSLEYKTEVEELAKELGIGDKVIFPPFRRDILRCMCVFDVLVHTSKEPEPFGRVLAEGMSVELPVIASPFGGPAEIIEHGTSGLLVNPEHTDELAEAIYRVLTDKAYASRLAAKARQVFDEKYDQAIETKAVEDIYRSIMAEGRKVRK